MSAADTLEEQLAAYSRNLGLELTELEPIRVNAYCGIHLAKLDGAKVILKAYYEGDPKLVVLEAEALELYRKIALEREELLDSGAIRLDAENRMIAMEFVGGDRFSDFLYRAARKPELRSQACGTMLRVGELLSDLRTETRSAAGGTDPFMVEYIRFTSDELSRIPLLGPLLFGDAKQSVEEIIDRFESANVEPSFAHGDMVFQNIHVDGPRFGLIDFANSIVASHTLNDVYNLQFGLNSMFLPAEFKRDLLAALWSGLGDLNAPNEAHEFYYEYHRRRWLRLKLRSRSPVAWLQALRGQLGFAKRWSRGRAD